MQESGVRSQNEEHLLSVFCLLLTADSLLHLKGVRVGGTPGPYRSLRQGVTMAGKEETPVTLKIEGTARECL